MNMDFNIVTFHKEYNYGAVLQAYALQEFINSLGFTSGIYDYTTPPSGQKPALKGRIINFILNLNKRSISAREAKYKAFIQDFMNLNTEGQSRAYVAGSDQVWNPCGAFDSNYFLKFVTSPSKKISYAASLGDVEIPEDKKSTFSEYIKDFAKISVREQKAKDLLNELYDKEISVNIDPTLLHKAEFYSKIENEVKGLYEKYILVYLMHLPKNVNKLIRHLKSETGYKVVLLDGQGAVQGLFDNLVIHDKAIHNAGPREFLWLFHHAECVVTSSFHGTAFSLIFHKEFYSISNSPKSRISNILKLCGLNALREDETDFKRNKSLDWAAVDAALDNERKRSEEFFRSALE